MDISLKDKKNRAHIADVRKKSAPVFRRYGVKKAAVFGSLARGTASKSSDVDILVELDKKKRMGLFAFVGMKLDLEKNIGKKVDLVTYKALHPLLKEQILEEQRIIYEKKS